jgi:hypothetical protein
VSGPEDTGSNTVRDAELFERWRAKNYEPDDRDEDEPRPQRRGLNWSGGCRCHSASEEPCDWCSRPAEEDE